MARSLRLGTRASRLARWQTEWVERRLASAGYQTELVEIHTTGDALPDLALSRIDLPDIFTRQLDQALLAGEIDLAVHSLKDLPTELPEGISLAAVSEREDPLDALVGREPIAWDDIPTGAVIATCSLRRRAQLLYARPDLVLADIRGNVETRLAKLDRRPEWTATVLAVAGLVRLGLSERIGERLPARLVLPAPGQGALAVTARTDDRDVTTPVRNAVQDPTAACCAAAERAMLRELGCGCHAPVAALAEMEGGRITLTGRVLSPSGDRAVEESVTRSVASETDAEHLGIALAERLLTSGAAGLLQPTPLVEP
jgi:hydroxymethylbilane synthase